MDRIQGLLETFDSWLWGDWLLFVLLGVGGLYTICTGAVQVRRFPYIWRACLWEPLRHGISDSKDQGALSSFQALCTALASCVGSGNIVGVSTAVLAGGMGALFWMWVAAFVGMATKYGEIVLGMLYRRRDSAGCYVGGPFYYIEEGLKTPALAVICALFMVLQIVGGNLIQSNTIGGVFRTGFGVSPLVTGVALTTLVFSVSLGGLRRLAHLAQRLVPLMAFLYVFGGLVILLLRFNQVPTVLAAIFQGAFSTQAAAGGVAGTVMKVAMERGIARGLYSNEAGEGSAPVIHSTAQVDHPCCQGLMGVMEVFLDTFVICTTTGLVLGVTGAASVTDVPGSVLALYAFGSVWEPLRYVVLISLLLFSFTTLVSQWYFGFVGLNYVWGAAVADRFKYIFPLFCILGATLRIEMVWALQDIVLGLLVLPNLVAMVILFPQVHRVTREFFCRAEFNRS